MNQQHQKSERLKKKPIRLTLSQKAREYIEKEFVGEASLATSISDFLEKIGLGELSVSSILDDAQPELLRLSASKRLLVLVKEPAAVFLSTLAFVLRVSCQLGLDSSKETLLKVMRQGINVVFEVGYTFPDLSIANPSALLRWAAFRVLYRKSLAGEGSANGQRQVDNEDTPCTDSHECLRQMNLALQGLEGASRSHKLEAFKMKAVNGFTISQILILFQVQSKHFTEEQAYRRIKDGWSIFREYWSRQDGTEKNSTLFNGRDVDEIENYCDLVPLKSIDSSHLEAIEGLLFQTANASFLDLLINEVDYHWYWKNYPEELEFLEDVRKDIELSIDEWLLEKKIKIDERLLFCRNDEDLTRILTNIIEGEIGASPIPVKAVLSKNYDVFQKINQRIKDIADQDNCDVLRGQLEKLRQDVENYANSSSWIFRDSS